ncbi:laccase [Decorospora gaudefroyi]|uniref:Laccase n=1 Tax=Decorospora gaudefroyi TaxID=184978 RepID=A0A6A5KNY2_9PLEO|nr:laccase [Decorospora gaudefroyi]
MLVPSTWVATLLGLSLFTVTSLAVPAERLTPRVPEVPWKKDGLWSGHKKRDGYNTNSSCNHGPQSRGCWNGDYNIDTDMDFVWPNTGKTVKYHLTISNATGAPDGFERPVFLINGQMPGPTLVADWGDDIEITVTNNLQHNGTGIHWHGLRQLGSNEQDGVNGITECPIAPGSSKVYKFKATQHGTTWYHSHYSVQYGDGLVGPFIIRGPSTANYDIDLGALPMTDWFHSSTFTVNAAALHATGPPTADNILINGTMTSLAGGKHAETILTPGKTHLLRLINTGINNYLHVGLDGHMFQVIAADFTPIVPYWTDNLVIAVGQRYEVIINATEATANYWFRVGTGGRCDGPNANAANIKSIFRYAGAGSGDPVSTGRVLPAGCYDEANIVPYSKTIVPREMPEELQLGFSDNYTTGLSHGHGLVQWLINGQPMAVDLEHPTLQTVRDGNLTYAANRHVFKVDDTCKWQYWVIQQDTDRTTPPIPHPVHLHGHDFYVLDSQEDARWNGDTSRLKTDNPIRRDTATLPAKGYLVLAFESDNPGAWLMHCHIPFHVAAGLGVQFLERPAEIAAKDAFLAMETGCKQWTSFTQKHYPDGILIPGDSGLRR